MTGSSECWIIEYFMLNCYLLFFFMPKSVWTVSRLIVCLFWLVRKIFRHCEPIINRISRVSGDKPHACLNTVLLTDLMAGYLLIVSLKYLSVFMRLTRLASAFLWCSASTFICNAACSLSKDNHRNIPCMVSEGLIYVTPQTTLTWKTQNPHIQMLEPENRTGKKCNFYPDFISCCLLSCMFWLAFLCCCSLITAFRALWSL